MNGNVFLPQNNPGTLRELPDKSPGEMSQKPYHFDISIYHIMAGNIVPVDLACRPFFFIINTLTNVS